MALLLLGAAQGGIGPATPVLTGQPDGLLVTVAEVRADRAVPWVRAPTPGRLGVQVGGMDEPAPTRAFQAIATADWDGIVRLPLAGLVPGTRYRYMVSPGRERVDGSFATAPAPGADAPPRLLWSGDLGGGGHCRDAEDGYRIFRAMARRGADLFLFVGDTAYADHVCGPRPHAAGNDVVAATLAEYRAKHRDNRADPAVQQLLRLTGVYAIWDDHLFLDRALSTRSLGALGLTLNFGEIVADGQGLVARILDRSGAVRRSVHLTADTTTGGPR